MKKINFDDLMSSVSEQFIDEAASFTPIKVFNTRFVALVACIAIIVTAIPAAVIMNREKEDKQPVVTTPAENIVVTPGGDKIENVKIIYCDATTATEIKKTQKDNNLEIRDISEIDTDLFSKKEDIDSVANIPARVYMTIGGKDYVFNFNSAYTNPLSTSYNEVLRKQGIIAEYKIEESECSFAYMTYCVETQNIINLKLQNFSDAARPDGKLTTEQITDIANRDLTDIYGEEFVQKYTHEKTSVWMDGVYSIEYRRIICGYPTNEIVRIAYNFDGEMIYLTAQNYGSFDYSEYFDEKAILDAEEAAIKLIDEETSDANAITEKELIVDKDGNAYLYVVYLKNTEYGRIHLHYLYHPIG